MNNLSSLEEPDEALRSNQEASSSSSESEPINTDNKENIMKRAAAKKLIERYFYQLTDGCGNPSCDNKCCASSGNVSTLTPDEAAAQAIQLFSEDARLCERHPNKIAKTQILGSKTKMKIDPLPTNEILLAKPELNSVINCKIGTPKTLFLNETILMDLIADCKEKENFLPLIRTLGTIFSSIECLSRSFLQTNSIPETDSNNPKTDVISGLDKEAVRSLEGEKDKDEDSCTEISKNSIPPVDIPSLRRCYSAILELNSSIYENTLVNALVTLAGNLQMELPTRKDKMNHDDILNVLIIVFEIPVLGSGDFLETALPAICRASQCLNVEVMAKLARTWSRPDRSSLRNILENLQQLITLRVIVSNFHREFYVQNENVITSATKLMKILYYANMLAGVLESSELRSIEDLNSSLDESYLAAKLKAISDPLATELGINVLDCRKPYLPFSDFYNEPLSEAIEMDKDFANYKSEHGKFSFMDYPFILTPATKIMGLYFDNRIRMYSERRISILQAITGQPSHPYLRLKVRRDHIIDDALVELEMISMDYPNDLKKQLVVEFEGEQGIDEGGVSKEFFQLVIEEIFNPDYGMFTVQPDSQTVWFNPTSFETDAQFTLIGIVLGLAIYNNVILAVNFPMVVYRKLMGKRGSFEDLQDLNPPLYNSLRSMLDYNKPDFEDVFMQTFRISYTDVFGSPITYDLKENGDEISVTLENKYDFVDLYANYLLNKSIEKQFFAFYKGFQMVVDESPLELLFRPEEIELLICGSKNFDFNELQISTEYDGGYTMESQTIKDFWSIVHAFSMDDKRKLLQFTTGSDRVPVGGLGRLKLVIAKNGPDSNRLPTSHTCFNVLLLPEYSSKEKLKDRLIKAINYSKGFGML